MPSNFHNHNRYGADILHVDVALWYLKKIMKERCRQIKIGRSAAIFVFTRSLNFIKNLMFWPITRKRLEIWHHDLLRMDRKPTMGSLGGPTILTPGAPDPQKLGVKN